MGKSAAIHSLEEVADRFLKSEYQRRLTFRGMILNEDLAQGDIEQWPIKYWYDGEREAFMMGALQGSTQTHNAGICKKMLDTARTIAQSGEYLAVSEPTPRFDIAQLAETHAGLLKFDSQRGFAETFDTLIGDGMWHLGVTYVGEESTGRMNVHFANNSPDEPTPGFERLYTLLFGNIFESYAGSK